MRVIALLLLVAVSAMAFTDNEVLITDEHVASINAVAKTWTASADQGAFFKGATKRQIMGLMGVKRGNASTNTPKMTYSVQDPGLLRRCREVAQLFDY